MGIILLFIGDVAFPDSVSYPRSGWPFTFSGSVVANLEGAVVGKGDLRRTAVFNEESVLDYLATLGVSVVSLANNHMFDIAYSPTPTKDLLWNQQIRACGAGVNLTEAEAPIVFKEGGNEYALLAFGWSVIGCIPATNARPGVNPLEPSRVLSQVRLTRKHLPSAKIVLLVHWNYELEAYPQPLHRELAMAAIDEGAHAVIGCHSHCVQGIELYKGAPIVYGLGNWFFPWGVFFDGRLSFPEFVRRELAFEWTPNGKMRCHWFNFDDASNDLVYDKSEELETSEEVRRLTPFAGMNEREYLRWFRSHRRKRKLLPVFHGINSPGRNRIKSSLVQVRQSLIGLLLWARLKGSPR